MDTTDKVLEFIRDFTKREGFPPTRGDIMVGCDLSSKSVVQRHVKKLAGAGEIVLRPGLARGILVGRDEVPIPG